VRYLHRLAEVTSTFWLFDIACLIASGFPDSLPDLSSILCVFLSNPGRLFQSISLFGNDPSVIFGFFNIAIPA
jgi:hypothetical protein